ncbi:MAG: hypothetical protein M0R21_03850 [Lentimicrobiaceae bacterium]|jgi:nitrite reductase/ring-hydroxylating ferredoxin subunit|nr:hypothetical protein [Lentimicrobiaceae bacterium]
MKFLYRILFLLVMFLPVAGCDDDYSDVPYAYIDIYINPNSTEYNELNTVNGWVYLKGTSPSRGIIVCRISQDEFMAYERTCPYDADKDNAIVEVESPLVAVDSLCGSRYILTDGSRFDGPAKLPLKQYRTNYNGAILHIYN